MGRSSAIPQAGFGDCGGACDVEPYQEMHLVEEDYTEGYTTLKGEDRVWCECAAGGA
jgi:hypothetical protein